MVFFKDKWTGETALRDTLYCSPINFNGQWGRIKPEGGSNATTWMPAAVKPKRRRRYCRL